MEPMRGDELANVFVSDYSQALELCMYATHVKKKKKDTVALRDLGGRFFLPCRFKS